MLFKILLGCSNALKHSKKYNYTLISTSTPLGNSSFIKASIVFDDEL